jgi:hypothetical protein
MRQAQSFQELIRREAASLSSLDAELAAGYQVIDQLPDPFLFH